MNKEYLGILLNFVLGGISVAGTSVLGNYMNPLAGAIFWAFPITIIPSLFFMRENGKDNDYLAKFLLSTTFGLILLGITTIAMSYFIRHESKETSLWNPIGKATLVYGGGAAIYYIIVKYCGLSHYFM
jgi:hypothetical protein